MTIHEMIYDYLQAKSAVTALVGTRVYPIVAPASAARPFIAITRTLSQHEQTLGAAGGMVEHTVSIDCWDDSLHGAADLATVVRTACDGFRGTIEGVTNVVMRLTQESDRYVEPIDSSGIGMFGVAMTFSVRHSESIPTF